MQSFNVVFDPLDELCLILPDRPADVGSDEQGVEAAKDAEHLVGVLGRAELISQVCGDTRLHAVDALFVPGQRKSQLFVGINYYQWFELFYPGQ